jgi:LacI family transcriptional regulator
MREVADRAQVAMSSVSRVLSEHPDVSTAMRERVLAAVAELGYRPDLLAQGLRRGATQSVGFLVGDIAHPLLAAVVKGAEARLRLEGYSVLIANSQRDLDFEGEQLRLFTQRRVDGMIVSLASETAPQALEALEDAEVPVVVVDRDLAPEIPASYVLTNHRTSAHTAVGHLLDLGHRRIGLIAGIDVRPTRERIAGARDAYAERGLAGEPELVIGGDVTPEVGERGSERLLDGPRPVTALIAGGNQILIGVLRTLQRRGLRYPDDLSLVTCGDTEITTVMHPPIGAVSRDDVAVGRMAAELLLRRLSSDDPGPETVVLEASFLARASCAPPPV